MTSRFVLKQLEIIGINRYWLFSLAEVWGENYFDFGWSINQAENKVPTVEKAFALLCHVIDSFSKSTYCFNFIKIKLECIRTS